MDHVDTRSPVDPAPPEVPHDQVLAATSVPNYHPTKIKRAPLLARFAVTMALLGCLVGMGWAFTLNQTEKQPDDVSLEEVRPPAGSKAVPGQTPVSVNLAYGFDAVLIIDGQQLARKHLVERVAEGLFTFTPGPGKPYERFENGLHTAQVIYWPKTGNQEQNGSFYQWTFYVV